MRMRIIVTGLWCLLAPIGSPASGEPLTFTTIPAPPIVGIVETRPAGINDAGDVVGNLSVVTFCDFPPCEGYSSSFLLSGEEFTIFLVDGPGSFSGINDASDIVGSFSDAVGTHAFLLSAGTFTTIDVPGAVSTAAAGINRMGQIVGVFTDASGMSHGFSYSSGSFITIDAPGAFGSAASGVNDAGDIVGSFSNATGRHGFILSGETVTAVDVPGAASTVAAGINATGQIVGVFTDVSGTSHGFLLAGGTFSAIDVPGARAGTTNVTGINATGQIVGSFIDDTDEVLGFLASASVIKVATTTQVLTAWNPGPFGALLTFEAFVDAAGGGTPTMGMVTFFDGTRPMGTSPVDGAGRATLLTSILATGAHVITAHYEENSNFGGSTSSPISQFITKGTTKTTTILTSSANPARAGQAVTFTATVSAVPPGESIPTGPVVFLSVPPGGDAADVLGTVMLNAARKATLTTSALSVGAHKIIARYDGNFATDVASSWSSLTETINKSATRTTVASSVSSVVAGLAVTFTAAVSTIPSITSTPTGPVTFFNGPTALGAATLNGGQAALTTRMLSAGAHVITAAYAGDANFNPSTSAPLTETVDKVPTTTTVTSATPSAVAGQAVTFTAAVRTIPSITSTPTGAVTFFNGPTALGTALLKTGQATLTTRSLSVGAHAITARYGGAANFRASTSPALTEIIHKAATAATVAASPNPAVLGQAVTFTAMASVIAPGAGIPLGPVTFLDRATVPGTAMLSAGQATLRTNTLSVGAYAITAHYGGATNFGPSASNALIETIDKAGIKTTVSASRTRRQEPSSPTTAGGGPGRDVPRDGKRASAGSGDAADRSQ